MIRIRDNEPGIPEDVLSHIFNPFFSTRRGAEGAGLSLPVAADVLIRPGGNLFIDTVYRECAEFAMNRPAPPLCCDAFVKE